MTAESPGVHKITPAGSTFRPPDFLTDLTASGTDSFKATELRLSTTPDDLVSTMEFDDAKGAKIVVTIPDYEYPAEVDKPADSEIMGG